MAGLLTSHLSLITNHALRARALGASLLGSPSCHDEVERRRKPYSKGGTNYICLSPSSPLHLLTNHESPITSHVPHVSLRPPSLRHSSFVIRHSPRAAHSSLFTDFPRLQTPCAFRASHRKKFRLCFCLGKTFAFAFPPLKSLVWNRASCDHTITANRNLHSCRSFTADHRLASANSSLAERLRIQSETRAPSFACRLEQPTRPN